MRKSTILLWAVALFCSAQLNPSAAGQTAGDRQNIDYPEWKTNTA
jgi:hypothetical protein